MLLIIVGLVDLEALPETVENSAQEKSAGCEEGSIAEPYVGREYDSEESARKFYSEYARHEGFIMRLDRCHRSDVDKRILSRRLSCNKQGFYAKARDGARGVGKPRVSIREGCEAMMLVKVNKPGKWVVTRFVKEHTHPLSLPGRPSSRNVELKDRKIQELTEELERQDQLCQLYRELLNSLLKNVEEQTEVLSEKQELVISTIKQLENAAKRPSETDR